MNHQRLRSIFRKHFPWDAWEGLIEERGVTIDRPANKPHPDYPSIIYPMDYGFVPGTIGSDGREVDVFQGKEESAGLVGLILSHDQRKGDREVNLLYNCSPREIYLAHGFINFDRSLLRGMLVMRVAKHRLW